MPLLTIVSHFFIVAWSKVILSHWVPLRFQGWLKNRNATEAEILRELFHGSFQEIYQYNQTMLFPKMVLLECNYIVQVSPMIEKKTLFWGLLFWEGCFSWYPPPPSSKKYWLVGGLSVLLKTGEIFFVCGKEWEPGCTALIFAHHWHYRTLFIKLPWKLEILSSNEQRWPGMAKF